MRIIIPCIIATKVLIFSERKVILFVYLANNHTLGLVFRLFCTFFYIPYQMCSKHEISYFHSL